MNKLLMLAVVSCIAYSNAFSQGNVYLVLGSDTGIWDGLNCSKYNPYYRFDLYTNPDQNGTKVMDEAFRNSLKDSYGQPVKLTWWMMAGNVYRRATNTNIPLPNTLVMHLMKKYQGERIKQLGDELSLHYHTYYWYDYNQDGVFWWNQSQDFAPNREDFDVTLAQFLLEENIFPVSFRSGWHFMDNEWQNYLNTILPFSLHNDYPHKHNDEIEPLDNLYDWSKAPAEFVPFHPSPDNYQLPGESKGWNVRSINMSSIPQSLMDSVFARAKRGIDQLVCLWAHLPEENFLEQIKRVDSLAHISAGKFTTVKFRYTTAIEGYQRWLKKENTPAPVLTVTPYETSGKIRYVIESDKPIFQERPFFAVKDIYENYKILNTYKTGVNKWITEYTDRKLLAKAAVTACDEAGSQTIKTIQYLPDDQYIDDKSSSFSTAKGNWTRISNSLTWDIGYAASSLNTGDSSTAVMTFSVPQSGTYNLSVRIPEADNLAKHYVARIYENGNLKRTVELDNGDISGEWNYISTIELQENLSNKVEFVYPSAGQAGRVAAIDVLKISALVKEKEIFAFSQYLNLGSVAAEDTASFEIQMKNRGYKDLTISRITSDRGEISPAVQLPYMLKGMNAAAVPFHLRSDKKGEYTDTISFYSDDPVHPVYRIAVRAFLENYFLIADDTDAGFYKEYGNWKYSTAGGYNGTSRYSATFQKPASRAEYTVTLKKNGVYDIFGQLPVTVNACDNALYVLSIDSVAVDSVYKNQNTGSGGWVYLFRSYLPASGVPVSVRIIDAMKSSSSLMLRADAVKFALQKETASEVSEFDETLPSEFRLMQNYPNPFNPSTVISYFLPSESFVTIKIYGVLGNEVKVLSQGIKTAGEYSVPVTLNAAAGVYFYRLEAESVSGRNKGSRFMQTKKMILMK